MPQKLALKLLTKSDLTLFEWHYKNRPAGNQKSTNLNANVFIQKLYRAVPEVMAEPERERVLPLSLHIFGPGLAGEYIKQRKILGGSGGYKNYRIDGETIHNPDTEPERFNILIPGDLVIMSFRGDVYPISVSMFYLAQNNPDDSALHLEFSKLVGDSPTRSMVELLPIQIQETIEKSNPDAEHPIYDLLLEDALEDAAQNGIEGIRRLRTKASRRRVSYDALRRARENASKIGRIGEEFVNSYLSVQKENKHIGDCRWIADENAVSPYDFEINVEGGMIFVDVKSTEGDFDNPIHISYNELLQMRESENYDLYRVFEITGTRARLRIAHNMQQFATETLEIFDQLPDGVRPDSISVLPEVLNFEETLEIEILEEDE